jgi:hypothetical protein
MTRVGGHMGTTDRPGGTGDQADVPKEIGSEHGDWKFTPSGSWLNLDNQSDRQLRAGHDQPANQQADRSHDGQDVEALPDDDPTGVAEPIKEGPWSPEYGVGTYDADRFGNRVFDTDRNSRLDRLVRNVTESAGDWTDVLKKTEETAESFLANLKDRPPSATHTSSPGGDTPYVREQQRVGVEGDSVAATALTVTLLAAYGYSKVRDMWAPGKDGSDASNG